ncbi:hypothetical protein [Flavivirga algicola]|uniref:Uncharacterized protein n=1 Tax=Flavivirga algicola TaxID=2729136 RepID=A0ABX1S216_9FLAO|nr:hypothetical protein [Flavivirga algicola]NMH89285.1 hypothetical protein [Flavivirga algicola]
MTTFENLKSQWDNQPELKTPDNGSKMIIEKVTFLKRKQRITNFVLTITAIILLGFFFYIAAYNNTKVSMALLLMFGAVLARIIVEKLSIRKLYKLDVTANNMTFRQKVVYYYKSRITTHYVITPILIILYITGFMILMPYFKQGLSTGFYTYIQVSGFMTLFVLVLLIGKQIAKEMKILKGLSS